MTSRRQEGRRQGEGELRQGEEELRLEEEVLHPAVEALHLEEAAPRLKEGAALHDLRHQQRHSSLPKSRRVRRPDRWGSRPPWLTPQRMTLIARTRCDSEEGQEWCGEEERIQPKKYHELNVSPTPGVNASHVPGRSSDACILLLSSPALIRMSYEQFHRPVIMYTI